MKAYWTRQWDEINVTFEPIGFNERQNGSPEVEVQQKVKDLQGNSVFEETVKHIYTFKDSLIQSMDIELTGVQHNSVLVSLILPRE